ncbi:MAG: hypothetical protein EOP61_15930 [Sphingomonadales bacterium]|nr:MAG: hypothetical protein EOP61_15930 [Sphingomonadales bacterium]
MIHAFRAAVCAAALLASADAAQAQGFLRDLVEGKVSEALRSGGGDRRQARSAGEARATPAPATTRPKAAAAATSKPIRFIGDMRAPAEVEAQKAAYNQFGEASCNDCEGGIALDGTPKFSYDQFSGQYGERAKRAGSWPVGHVHRWQGKASAGTLTVKSEERVDGFRCRRLEYKLVRGSSSASRASLICWGMASSESSVENWHEVY